MNDRGAGKLTSSVGNGLAGRGAIERLRDIEEIRLLKHRYMRCIDMKLWDGVGDAFTVNATFGTGTSAFGKPVEISGGSEIVAFLRARLGPAVLSEHTVSQPEITVDGDEAEGVWAQRETILATKHRMIITGTGFCEERYVRGTDGRWLIARTSYARSYEAVMSLDDLPSFKLLAMPDGEESVAARRDGGPRAGVPVVGPWMADAAS
jgi:SnoaL-like protein